MRNNVNPQFFRTCYIRLSFTAFTRELHVWIIYLNVGNACNYPKYVNVYCWTRQNVESWTWHYQANIYLFKVNNKSTRKMYEISSKLTIKKPEGRQWRRSDIFIVNFEHISHLFLEFLLLTLNKKMLARQLVRQELYCE